MPKRQNSITENWAFNFGKGVALEDAFTLANKTLTNKRNE